MNKNMLTDKKEFDKNKEENWKREALSLWFSIVGWDEDEERTLTMQKMKTWVNTYGLPNVWFAINKYQSWNPESLYLLTWKKYHETD